MTDSLLTASATQLRDIASVFAKTFLEESSAAEKHGTNLVTAETPEERKERRAKKEHLTLTQALNKDMKSLGITMKRAFSDFFSSIQKEFTLARIAQKALKDFQSEMVTGADQIGWFNKQWGAIKIGMSAAELNKLNQEVRLTALSMGGYQKWMENINVKHREYFDSIGDAKDTTKFLALSLKSLADVGIQPTTEAFDAITEGQGRFGRSIGTTVKNLHKLGIPLEQQSALLKEISQDQAVRNRLRGAADEQQRQAILRGTYARFQEFRQMGMNIEQIKKANSALEQLGGKGPKERFKQAAQAQAALSAMGIEGADRVANVIRLGDRATEEQKAEAARIMGRAQDMVAESRQGTLGREFTIATIMEKSGISNLLGKEGPFSTKLEEQKKVNDKQLNALTGLNDKISDFMYWKNIIMNAIKDSTFGSIIGTVFTAFFGFKTLKWFFMGVKNIFQKIFGKIFPSAIAADAADKPGKGKGKGKGTSVDKKPDQKPQNKPTQKPSGVAEPKPTSATVPKKPTGKEKSILAKAKTLLKNPKAFVTWFKGLKMSHRALVMGAAFMTGAGAAGVLIGLGAGLLAEYGLTQAWQTAMTGRSDVHDNYVNQATSHGFAKKLHWVAGKFGAGNYGYEERRAQIKEKFKQKDIEREARTAERLAKEKAAAAKLVAADKPLSAMDVATGTKKGMEDVTKKQDTSNNIQKEMLDLQRLQTELLVKTFGSADQNGILSRWENMNVNLDRYESSTV